MPTRRYALEQDGPKRLEISWKGNWKDFTIQLDGNPIGTIPGHKELSAGQEFQLPDGSALKVRLVRKFSATELQILRNGKPLPGSASDPTQKLQVAYVTIFFIAGLNIVLGLVATLLQVEFLQEMGIGLFSVVFGLVFLGLGFLVTRRSAIALVIAIALFGFDGLLGIVLVAQQGGTPSVGGLIFRVLLLIPMFQGIGAIRELKQQPPG